MNFCQNLKKIIKKIHFCESEKKSDETHCRKNEEKHDCLRYHSPCERSQGKNRWITVYKPLKFLKNIYFLQSIQHFRYKSENLHFYIRPQWEKRVSNHRIWCEIPYDCCQNRKKQDSLWIYYESNIKRDFFGFFFEIFLFFFYNSLGNSSERKN